MDAWERLSLAKRKLELAVREEDYVTAAAAKAEMTVLRERLPADKMLLVSLLDKLEAHTMAALRERLAAVRHLGELGDFRAAPALANTLHDSDPAVAEAAEESLWAIFTRCPTAELEMEMQRGVTLMQRPESWEAALDIFTAMTERAPTFAEAFNKRATVLYLLQRYALAVVDCRITLQMNPWHFAAASGLGMCCSAAGDVRGAVAAFEHAVAINPRLGHLRQHILQLRHQLKVEEEQEQQRNE